MLKPNRYAQLQMSEQLNNRLMIGFNVLIDVTLNQTNDENMPIFRVQFP